MKLALTLLLFCSQSFAASYVQPLAPGCHVSSMAQVSLLAGGVSLNVGCDAVPIPVPVPTACTVIHSVTPGIASFTCLTGTWPVNYGSHGIKQVDVTKFGAVFPPDPWPGPNGGIVGMFTLATNRYVSLQFTVPVGMPSVYGQYSIGFTGYSAPITQTISKARGDFSNPALPGSTVVAGCWKNAARAGGGIVWRTSAASGSACILAPGTYYLNLANIDAANVLPNGGGSATSTRNGQCTASCTVPTENGPGTF